MGWEASRNGLRAHNRSSELPQQQITSALLPRNMCRSPGTMREDRYTWISWSRHLESIPQLQWFDRRLFIHMLSFSDSGLVDHYWKDPHIWVLKCDNPSVQTFPELDLCSPSHFPSPFIWSFLWGEGSNKKWKAMFGGFVKWGIPKSSIFMRFSTILHPAIGDLRNLRKPPGWEASHNCVFIQTLINEKDRPIWLNIELWKPSFSWDYPLFIPMSTFHMLNVYQKQQLVIFRPHQWPIVPRSRLQVLTRSAPPKMWIWKKMWHLVTANGKWQSQNDVSSLFALVD